MKTRSALSFALLLAAALTGCSTTSHKTASNNAPGVDAAAPAKGGGLSKDDGKAVKNAETDEYADVTFIPDPLEPLNRGTFWFNHQLYHYVLHPVSKTYETVLPKPVRTGLYNAFDNVEFPIRVINDALQGDFNRAKLETGRFLVNSTVGVGGLGRPSDHIPALANVPPGETGLTFAKWGIKHGFYFVIPILGPSSARDAVGLVGDYALNPITWVSIVYGGYTWLVAISATNTMTGIPGKLATYDAITKNAVDRYVAARSAYVQYRAEAAKK